MRSTRDIISDCIEVLGRVEERPRRSSHEKHVYAIETYRGPQLPKHIFDKDRVEGFRNNKYFVWFYGIDPEMSSESQSMRIEAIVPKIHEYMKTKKIKGIITIVFKSNYDEYDLTFKLLYVTVSQEDYFILHRKIKYRVLECDDKMSKIQKLTDLLRSFHIKLERAGYNEIMCNSCQTKKINFYKKMLNKFLDVPEDFILSKDEIEKSENMSNYQKFLERGW